MVSNKRMVNNTEIGGSFRNPKRRRSRKNYADNCLPDDVLFNIFMRFPTDVIYNVLRLVCKQWFNIIQSPLFISSHLKKDSNTNCVLIHERSISVDVVTLWSDHGGRGRALKAKHLNFPFIKRIGATCNGLLFVVGPIKSTSNCPSYILNPVTKQNLPLPLFPDLLVTNRCCFGYAADSRLYKVMHYPSDPSRCLILTVGVDKAWRKVDISQLSDTGKLVLRSSYSSFTVRGSAYWLLCSVSMIVRFDMETETFVEIHVSSECFDQYYGLIAMENSVCLWMRKVNDNQFWVLKDVEKGDGQWEKLLHINEKGLRRLPWYIIPAGWLRSRELFVFRLYEGVMVYNVNTGQVHQTKEMKKTRMDTEFYVRYHVDSLVPLNNLSLVMTPRLPFKSPEEVYSKENMRSEFHKFKEEP